MAPARTGVRASRAAGRSAIDAEACAVTALLAALIGLVIGVVIARAWSRRETGLLRAQLSARLSELSRMQGDLDKTRAALDQREAERRAALNIAADAREVQRKAEEAEPQAALTVESAPNAMVMIDAEGAIVLVNAEAERIFGYSRSAMLDRSVDMLVPVRFRHLHPDLRRAFFASPETRAMGAGRDLFALRSDGSEFPVEIGLNPIDTPQGRFVLSAIVDISERKDAQRRFELAVESAPNAMVMIDAEGAIVLVNAEAERIFGYSRSAMLGRPVDMLIPVRFRHVHPDLRRAFFASPETRAMGAGRDLFALRSDGSEFPVEIGLNPIETTQGRFVLSAIVDNTERKRTADELQRRSEEMEQLLHSVSHDLKSPLVTIQGFAGMIASALAGNEHARALDAAERVMRGTRTMAALIDDLLLLSRVEAEEQLDSIDVGALVSGVRDALDAQFERARAELEIETDLPRIRTAPNRLHQIFSNLIENALKYGCVKEGSSIYVGFRDAPRHYEFYVRDQGPGIERRHHDRIFVVFRRLSTEPGGSGLGLAIVRKAARSLGGQAWLESAAGCGATFWFSVAKDPPGQRRAAGDRQTG